MLNYDEMPWLYVGLTFLTFPPAERQKLFPNVWTKPVYIDNGLCFRVEQPIGVMQDFCYDYLRIYEDWQDDVNFTALALATEAVQQQVERDVETLREQALNQSWQVWLKDEQSIGLAQQILHILQWPLLLGECPPLTASLLYQILDDETYGTFTNALYYPEKWQSSF